MSKRTNLTGAARQQLIHELHRRYAKATTPHQRWTYLRKRYSWVFVVSSAKAFKRFVDIVVSTSVLTLLSPLFLLIAGLIKATDRGPILYVSNRVGQWGKEFRFPKFRSMHVDAEERKARLENELGQSVTFKMKNDPRVTWVGRVIRKTSLDELPQLWCVLKGEMSLVGPRPPLPSEVEKYTLAERRRLDIVPGLTCIWQVSGRSDIPFQEQVQLDLEYIRSQSFWVDLKILLKTIPAVILGKGAY
ncbi:MAG: sugar transferase [Chlamydiales bacterium]|nr:sugar transferase [Chlamydiales bacterium]